MALREGSRFFKPSMAQYTSRFVEQDDLFPELLALGERDQQKRDFARGKLDQISQYLQVEADPSQAGARTELLSGFQGRIGELSEKLLSGASPDEVLGGITRINTAWQQSERRRELDRGFLQGQAYETQRREQTAENIYRPWLDKFEAQRKSQVDEFSPLNFQGMEGYIDPLRSATAALGTVARSGDLKTLVSVDEKTGAIGSITRGKSGVTPAQLLEASNHAAKAWRRTDAGRQREIEMRHFIPNVTEKELVKDAAQFIYNVGANQLGMQTQYSESLRFSEGAKEVTTDPSEPAYDRRPDQYDFDTLDPKDLYKEIIDVEATQAQEAKGKGIGKYKPTILKYKGFSPEEQIEYKNIIRSLDPQGKTMDDNQLDEYLKTDEAKNFLKEYIDKRGPVQYQSVVNSTPYYDEGAKTDFHLQEEKRIRKGSRGYRWMDARTGKIIEAGTKGKNQKDKNKYERLMKKVNTPGGFDVVGDEDYKNFHVLKAEGDSDFANAWRVKVTEDGEETEYIVTKPDSNQEIWPGPLYKNLNKIHTDLQVYPGVFAEHTILDKAGTKYTYDIKYNKESGTWTFVDVDDRNITGIVKDLKLIVPTARALQAQLQQ